MHTPPLVLFFVLLLLEEGQEDESPSFTTWPSFSINLPASFSSLVRFPFGFRMASFLCTRVERGHPSGWIPVIFSLYLYFPFGGHVLALPISTEIPQGSSKDALHFEHRLFQTNRKRSFVRDVLVDIVRTPSRFFFFFFF